MLIHTHSKNGFTLIELLVVVAIIGMLSSIVLTNLNSARLRGGDAGVQANLRTVTSQTSIYFDANNNFGPTFSVAACPTSGTSMFFADVTIRNAIAQANTAGGNGGTRCASNGTDFAVSVRLASNTNQHWCVDSSGAARRITNLSWTGNACP